MYKDEKTHVDNFEYYQNYLRIVSTAYRKVDETNQILEGTIEPIYFVDCSEILGYFFPFDDLTKSKKTVSKPDDPEFIRNRIALNSIFNSNKNIYILPPHSIELKKYLDLLEYDFGYNKEIETSLKKEVKLLEIEIAKKEIISDIKNFSTHAEKNDLDDELRKKIVSVIEEYYSRLKTLKFILNIHGVSTLNSFIKSKKIRFFDDLEEELDFEIDENEIIKNARSWYYLLKQIRSYHIDTANYMDAVAAAYLNSFNKKFTKGEKPRLGILISRSAKLNNLIDSISKISYKGKFLTPTRNLEYFILKDLYDFLKNDSQVYLYEYLRNDFNSIKRSYEATIFLNNQFTIDYEEYKNLKDKIKSIINALANKRDLILYLSENRKIYPKAIEGINLVKKKSTQVDSFYSILINLLSLDEELIEEIKRRQEETSEIILKLTNELTKRVNTLVTLSSVEIDKINFTELGGNFRLEGIKGEMPTIIRFYDHEVFSFAKDVFNLNNKLPLSSILEKLIDKKKDSPEYTLLQSYIEACLERWDDAINHINETIISISSKKNLLELYYLKIFLLRKTEKTLDGYKSSIDALNIDRNDPRILREQGVIIWQAYQNEPKFILDFEKTFGFKPDRNTSLNTFIQALENINPEIFGSELLLRCYNSLAYLYSESNSYNDIIHFAEFYINEIDKIEPQQKNLPPRFLDTRGFIKYKKCILGKNTLSVKYRINLLNNAMKDFKEALSSGGLIGKELQIVQRNFFNCVVERGLLGNQQEFA